MVSSVAVALGLVAFLAAINYFSEGALARTGGVVKERFVSFVAGLSASYIFLHLFPLVYSGTQVLQRLIFIAVLFGFVAYHLVEKWIYKHAPRDKIVREVEEEHAITLFFYHFFIGIVFVSLIEKDFVGGLLYFLPVSLHVIINSLPHSHRFQRKEVKALFAGAPFFGVLFGSGVPLPEVLHFALLGVVTGLLLFLEAREVIPEKRKGSALFFLVGVIAYGALIMWSWFI